MDKIVNIFSGMQGRYADTQNGVVHGNRGVTGRQNEDVFSQKTAGDPKRSGFFTDFNRNDMRVA
jgi:hypothetical protein